MSIDITELNREAKRMSYWQARKFWVMVAGALVIALFLVMIAMNLYSSSGTAQIDLSRPGYEDVRDQVGKNFEMVSYPSTGELDKGAFDDFRKLYVPKMNKLREGKYYSSGALTDKSLNLPRISD